MNARDAKLIGAVYGALCLYGAASIERLVIELGRNRGNIWGPRDIQWALTRLDCTEGGGLWALPDRMIPYGGLES